MATGYLGSSGISTYFKNGPISLGVTMPANTYPNGTITFDDVSQTTCYFHNGHVDAQVLSLYLCDSAGNNAKKICDITIPGNSNLWTLPAMSISGATGLAGKALYIKATGSELALNRCYFRNRTAITIPTASVALAITCQVSGGHGTLTANKSSAAPGTQITLTPTPATGYELNTLTSSPSVTISGNKFTMPSSAITITATFKKKDYTITKKVSPSGAGTVTAPATANYGDSVSISQTPTTGYYFKEWTTSPALTISGGSFSMPAQNVTVTANYLKRSTATLDKTTLTGGGTAKLTITSESASYTHKYKLSFGTNMETSLVSVAAGVTSVNISIPESWSNYIPNAATKTGGTLIVETYSGSTKIGTFTISSLTYAVPASAVPALGTITTSIARTIGGVTYANVGDYYVQKHCGVRVQGSATAQLSATIVTMKAELIGYSGGAYSATVSGSSIDFTSGLLLQAGTAQIKVTATDSRGRQTSTTANITVTAYNAPDGVLEVRRVDVSEQDDDTGIYAKFELSKAFTAIGSNSLTATMISQGSSEVISADSGNILPNSRQTFSAQQEYTIQVTLEDAFESVTLQAKLRSAKFILYVSADGNKLGMMKAANKTIPSGKNANVEISGDAQVWIGDDKIEDLIKSIIEGKILNVLNSDSITDALSAAQGKALNTAISGKKNTQTAVSDPTASGTTLEFISGITQNAQGVISPSKKTVKTANNLTTTASGSVLDARQGKALKDAIDEVDGKIFTPSLTNSSLSDKSIANNTVTNLGSVTLNIGTYILFGTATFAENATGYRRLIFADTSTGTSYDRYSVFSVGASSSGITQIQLCWAVKITANSTKIYLNARQNSGGALNVTYPGIKYIKIA